MVKNVGVKLALIGSIKQQILDENKLANKLLVFLVSHYKNELETRYNVVVDKELDDDYVEEVFEAIARNRGLLLSGGIADTEKSRELLLKEFRDGRIVNASLERCDDDGWFRV